jgi:hypothetical protein
MSAVDLKAMTVDQLVDQFAMVAEAQEEAILGSTSGEDDPTRASAVEKMRELAAQLHAVDDELRARGHEVRLALLRLYDHDNAQVNYEAAYYTLGVAPDVALERMHAIADSDWPPQYWQARTVILALDRGIFKPD